MLTGHLPTPLIAYDTEKHLLGMKEMDTIHVDFIKQINALELMYGEELQAGFSNLLQHSIRHFEREDELMQAYAFPQIVEHREQHRKVLAEMTRFAAQLKEGKSIFARAYIRQRLPEWFNLHLTTMDSALAWYLKNHTQRFNTRVRSNYAI